MRGLRTQESDKFMRYIELVQKKAESVGTVFFFDTGEGNDFETDTMEGETLSGWLIPKERADEFEEIWKEGGTLEDFEGWDKEYCFVKWKMADDEVMVSFKQYD